MHVSYYSCMTRALYCAKYLDTIAQPVLFMSRNMIRYGAESVTCVTFLPEILMSNACLFDGR